MVAVFDQGRLLGAGSGEAVVVGADDVLGAGDAGRETKALRLVCVTQSRSSSTAALGAGL